MNCFLSFALDVGESKSWFWDVAAQSVTYWLLNRMVCSASTGSAWDLAGISLLIASYEITGLEKNCGRVQNGVLVTGKLTMNIMRE